MECSDARSFLPTRFVAFACRYHPHTDVSLPSALRGPPRAGGLLCRFPPCGSLSNGNDRASQVPGGPPCTCPALRPRRDLRARPYGASVRPSAFSTASAPAFRLFRGSITRPVHPLSTLRRMDHSTTTQDSLPAVASFAGQDASSCKVPTKGFSYPSHPPFPSFSWRKQNEPI
jgi:hypothetical protein